MCELVRWYNFCKNVIVLSIHKSTSASAGELHCVCNVVVKCESRFAAKSFSTTLQGIGNLYFYFHRVIITQYGSTVYIGMAMGGSAL